MVVVNLISMAMTNAAVAGGRSCSGGASVAVVVEQ